MSGIMDAKPISGSQFVSSMGVQFHLYPDGHIKGTASLQKGQEGPPAYVHGGASASIIDEAMGAAVWNAGYQVVAASLHFRYRLPLPLEEDFTIEGWIDQVDGRKVYAKGTITLADGRIAVEGEGLFVEAPHLFEGAESFVQAFKAE